jgi:hypothetical protein
VSFNIPKNGADLKFRAAQLMAFLRQPSTWAAAREFVPWINSRSVRRRRAVVIAPYTRMHSPFRQFGPTLLFPALFFFCFLYGFYFALTAPFLMIPFAVPVLLLAGFAIWALPDAPRAPTFAIEVLFAAYFISRILWPDYLAIAPKGLPWINALRITAFPLLFMLMICLSVSQKLRTTIYETATSIKPMWYMILGLIGIQILTIPISPVIGGATQITVLVLVQNFMMFFIACAIFRRVEYVERYWGLLCAMAVPIVILTAVEYGERHTLWMNTIPKFLLVPDDNVARILSPEFRTGTLIYRAKGPYRTALVLAEYLCLLTPFFIHFGMTLKSSLLRVASFAMIPACFIAIRMTDSRLGLVGMLICILLYSCFWAVDRWRRSPHNLFNTAVLFSYPATFIAVVIAIFASNRMSTMLLGGGSTAGSTAARNSQVEMAIDALLRRPIGYGPGQSGQAMGFGEGEFVTVDNYFISVALDLGVLGVIFWYGTFLTGLITGGRFWLATAYAERREAKLLAPLLISLAAFVVIKWVHGQGDLHSIQFMQLGMLAALVYRLRQPEKPAESANSPV